MHITKYYCPT